MKAAFILNPSQRWKRTPLPKLISLIQSRIPVPSQFFAVDRAQPQSLETQMAAIEQGGFDTLVVGAGDGTLNRTINYLARKNALGRFTLGMIPLGTCNDFAKILGFRKSRTLRRSLQIAGDILHKKHVREITVAKVNEHYFINNAGFGRRHPAQKKRGLIGTLNAMKSVPTSLRWGGHRHDDSFLMLLAANAPYFSNGLHFSNDSDPSDDQLEFFGVKSIGRLRLLTKLLLGVRGFAMMRRHNDSAVWKAKASEMDLKCEAPVWIMADGETVESLSEIHDATFKIAGKARFFTAR